MGFLGALADQINSQFNLGENTNHSLDNFAQADDGSFTKLIKYGSLGDFAGKFDQSAERRYVEEGYLRKDPYNTDPKQFEVLLQEPNATVLIKKKMFSSVGDNFRPDFMDKDEKMYYKAMRILFQNKCNQIGALEKLSKIQKITDSVGSIPNQMIPLILSTSDNFMDSLTPGSNLFGSLTGGGNPLSRDASALSKAKDRLRRFYAFNVTNPTTTWITDSTNMYQSQFGQGTGVIEISNFANFNTSVSTDINSPGSFGLSIMDPYESMLITEYDIEKAISDATNMFYNSKFFQFAKESANKLIGDLTSRLNHIRSSRGVGPISIKLEPDTLLGRRVRAIIDRKGIEIPFDYESFTTEFTGEALFSGGAFEGGAKVPPEYFKDGSAAGVEGLDPFRVTFKGNIDFKSAKHLGPDSELSIFSRLISTIFQKLSQDANSQNAFQTMNKDTNYTRRKLRFNFSGKLVIQPMDIIHIYINSKSRYDNKLLSGLQNMFTGLGMLQNLNNTITDFHNAVDTLFRPSGSIPLQIEKSAFVGPEFPNSLWSLIRGSFVTENEGAHVFGGVVTTASDNWSDGKFTVEVSGKDNSAYFDQGRVNFKPGVDNFNGVMFDPLTPFRSEFDTITSNAKDNTPELLLENQSLLGSKDSAGAKRSSLIKHKLGRYAGELVAADNIIQDRSIDPVTGRITKVFYAPDGLVYKWKEGIGIFTQAGSNLLMNNPNRSGAPNINKEPFAGQDVMNVLSLLVTGQPYNFYNYFKAARQFDNFGNDPQSKENAAHSYTLSLRNDLIKNNTLWGNFIPFKNLVIDEASYAQALNTQSSIVKKNQVLDEQLSKLRDLNKIAIVAGAVNVLSDGPRVGQGPPGAKSFPQIVEQLNAIKAQVDKTQGDIQKENDLFLAKNGRDLSGQEATDFIDPQKIGASVSDGAIRKTLRRKLNFLTRRMSYNVRANEDKNLFIVDDFYDKDFDILAYEKTLNDSNAMSLYNNDYTSIRDKIAITANLLNLEVFCDTQGHIRCRPPQYNRMPSSVFYRMMYLKDTLNIQVFPQFLDDLFNTKLDTLKTRIEILEDQIRLDCAILNHKSSMSSDEDAKIFIISSNPQGGSFFFLSDPISGTVTRVQDLMIAANPDAKAANKAGSEALTEFSQIKGAALSTKDPFSNFQKYQLTIRSLTKQLVTSSGTPLQELSSATQDVVDKLVGRIQSKSGQKINTSDYLDTDQVGVVGVAIPTGLTVDVFKLVGEISSKINERQKVLRLFYNTIKNAQEYKSLDDNGAKTANKLLTPGTYGKDDIPEVFEHMIEDESYDDLGPGSGSRYIIKRAQIKSISITENPPPFTSIEVQGVLNQYDPKALPAGLNAFPGGGNGMVTALAVDYDMWRNYGFKDSPPLQVPFLTDPVSQCGPYAAMLLSRNRKNILKGTVTISGNEFMQPGEVVFLEDRGLLFYVSSVKHSFTFGTSFTTTLDLTYGHTPGEYIPTVMDMIGKMIYNNKDIADLTVQRQDTSANELNVGVVQLAPNSKAGDPGKSININAGTDTPQNSFATANAQVINNILYVTAYKLNAITSSTGGTATAKIELRTYYDNKKYTSPDSDLQVFANQVRQILVGESMPGLSSVTITKQGVEPTPLSPNQVISPSKSTVNLDDANDRRSPSQAAFDAARNQINIRANGDGGEKPVDTTSLFVTPQAETKEDETAAKEGKAKVDNDKIRTSLVKYIVDCWITVIPDEKLANLELDKSDPWA